MNKRQTEVEKQILENERQILKDLKNNYVQALKDVKTNIKALTGDEMTQSKIYQKQYQENLERQLQANIDLLSTKNFNSISDYLKATYQDGFIGTLYNMQNEGLPFIMPLNQETIIKSIMKKTEDFQLSKTLYQNAEELKKAIKSEITRGISQGLSYGNIAKKISLNSEADLKKSYRIARTEGGRVSSEAKFEVMKRAKENGANVVKEWDSTIDRRTRDTHARLDGQIRELEEEFEIDGMKAMYPHGFGIASEDINCRCVVLERARWAVEDDSSFTKVVDGDMVEFKNTKDYQDFKKNYFKFYENHDKINTNNLFDKLGIDISTYDLTKSNNIQELTAKLLGIDKLPTILDKYTYAKTDGHEIIRYLRNYKETTAEEAYKNTLYNDIQYSDVKNSQYGRGIYFGEKADEIELLHTYGDGNGKVINAKISQDANILEFNSMISYIKDVTERTKKLPDNLKKVYDAERSLLYMLDGYDGIKINSRNYYCIYNRKVLLIKDEQ